jgi:hypothetical protein
VARIVQVEPDAVVVRLTGWTALAALKRGVRVPMRAIRSVSTGRYDTTGFRIAGTAIPWTDIRAGRFRRGGLWTFLSFDDRDKVVTLELDRTVPGAAYDLVVVGVDEPDAVSAEIDAWRSAASVSAGAPSRARSAG